MRSQSAAANRDFDMITGRKSEMEKEVVVVDRNPMNNKFKSPKETLAEEEMRRLANVQSLKSIFMNAVPQECRKSFESTTSGLLMKSRYFPPRIKDELTVSRELLSEKEMEGTGFKPDIEDHDDEDDNDDAESDVGHNKGIHQKDIFEEFHSNPGSSLLNIDKKRRFAMSMATLASKPQKRMVIVREGAIQVLKTLSCNPDETVQRCCSAAFSFLSSEQAARVRMLDEGAGAAISKLAMSSNQNVVVKHNCCRAMCNLCVEVGCESRLIRDGCLAALMNIINYCPETVDICLVTLFNMSCVSDRFPRIEEMTEVLLRLQVTLSNRVQENMYLTTLCNLSAIRGNQLRMVEDGVQKIVDRVRKSPDLALRMIGAQIFSNFCTDNRAKAKMVENHAIPTMISMMTDTSEEIRCQAVKVFYSLSKDLQLRHKFIFNEKAVSLIVLMGRESFLDLNYGRSIAKVFRSLCKEAPIAPKLVREGIVISLQWLLQYNDPAIRHLCTESLCYLFEHDEVVKELVYGSSESMMSGTTIGLGVQLLISLAMSSSTSTSENIGNSNTDDDDTFMKQIQKVEDGEVLEWTLYSLYRLCLHNACPITMLQQQILPCAVAHCQSKYPKPRYFCAGLLKLISCYHDMQLSVAIQPVIDMMQKDSNEITQRNCAASLANMIHDSNNCALMLKAGALPHIVKLCGTEFLATKIKCAAIFSRLSLHEHYFEEFARDDVMAVLLSLCTVDNLQTQRWVVMALSNLSHKENLRELLVDLNPVPNILSMAAKRDETLRRGCAAILCNMSCSTKPGSEQKLIGGGVVPSLLVTAMIASDQTIAKVICVKALINLMGDPACHALLAKEGVIWCLSSLALQKLLELSLLCMSALSVFAKDFPRDMLGSPATVKAVLWAIGGAHESIQLQRLGARILTHMLRDSNDNDTGFRKQAVENMIPLANSDDAEIADLCIVGLCYASQSEACRGPIAQSGILMILDSESLWTNRALGYAYLTLIDNVANESTTRSQVLVSTNTPYGGGNVNHTRRSTTEPSRSTWQGQGRGKTIDGCALLIERFIQIVSVNQEDEGLVQAASKTLYSLSCCHENVAIMAKRNVLKLVRTLWSTRRYPDFDVPAKSPKMSANNSPVKGTPVVTHPTDQYLLACMYNLSTCPDTQAHLVSESFMALLVNMFRIAKADKSLCVLAYYAAFHMACGSTSSSRLVDDGIASILCHIQSPEGKAFHRQFPGTFSLDMQMRCAMSFRNLICVVANQQVLVSSGCIPALVELAEEALIELGGSSLDRHVVSTLRKGISYKEIKKMTISTKRNMTKKQDEDRSMASAIRKNAAAALRCLTFNKDFRGSLGPLGAVVVLLEDLTQEMNEHEQDFKMDYSLLSELEAESWQNGSRGQQKEGRAITIAPAPLDLDLLGGNKVIVLDDSITQCLEVLTSPKYVVKVSLEDTSQKSGRNTVYSDNEEILQDDIASLTRFQLANAGGAGGAPTLHDDGIPVPGLLVRRPTEVLKIGDAIYNTPIPRLAKLSEIFGTHNVAASRKISRQSSAATNKLAMNSSFSQNSSSTDLEGMITANMIADVTNRNGSPGGLMVPGDATPTPGLDNSFDSGVVSGNDNKRNVTPFADPKTNRLTVSVSEPPGGLGIGPRGGSFQGPPPSTAPAAMSRRVVIQEQASSSSPSKSQFPDMKVPHTSEGGRLFGASGRSSLGGKTQASSARGERDSRMYPSSSSNNNNNNNNTFRATHQNFMNNNESPMMFDLPPIGGTFTPHGGVGYEDGGSMLSVSMSSGADGSSKIIQRPKKKGQFNQKERKYNKLVSLINSTRRTKKWDVDTVLSEFSKISNL